MCFRVPRLTTAFCQAVNIICLRSWFIVLAPCQRNAGARTMVRHKEFATHRLRDQRAMVVRRVPADALGVAARIRSGSCTRFQIALARGCWMMVFAAWPGRAGLPSLRNARYA